MIGIVCILQNSLLFHVFHIFGVFQVDVFASITPKERTVSGALVGSTGTPWREHPMTASRAHALVEARVSNSTTTRWYVWSVPRATVVIAATSARKLQNVPEMWK